MTKTDYTVMIDDNGLHFPAQSNVSSVKPGTIVQAIDRGNFGTVISDCGETCKVKFVSPDGDIAENELPKSDLKRQNGTPLDKSIIPPILDPFEPFPVDALPEPLQQFVVEGAEAIRCDASYLALPLLSAVGAAIGNSRRLHVKRSWSVPAIVWTAIIGESGTAKSPAFRLVLKYFRDRQSALRAEYDEQKSRFNEQHELYELDVADWKKSRKQIPDEPRPDAPTPPTCKRVIVQDTTIEGLLPILQQNPNGLLVERDELAGWFGSFDKYSSKGQSDSSYWLSMFNAEPIHNDRVTTGYIHVPSAYVCVTGGIQPGIMARTLTDENKESGLAARILMTLPPRKAKVWKEDDISETIEEKIEAVFESLFDLEPTIDDETGNCKPVVLGLTADAKKVWINFYNNHNKEQVETSGELAAAYSKLEEFPLRFALIIQLVKNATANIDGRLVNVESIKAGITLANWFKREACRIYAILAESIEAADARKLSEWIERKGGRVTVRQVQQGHRKYRTAEEAHDALKQLVEFGFGTWENSPSDQRGQPTQFFVLFSVNTSTVYGNSANPSENTNTVDSRHVDTERNENDESNIELEGSIEI